MLILKYERRNFFGKRVYTEDDVFDQTKEDVKKAFLFLSRNHDAAIEIQEKHTVYFWDCVDEFDNRKLTVRKFFTDKIGYEEKKEYVAQIEQDDYNCFVSYTKQKGMKIPDELI